MVSEMKKFEEMGLEEDINETLDNNTFFIIDWVILKNSARLTANDVFMREQSGGEKEEGSSHN